MRKKAKSWDLYEKELLRAGRISKEEMAVEKMKMDFAKMLYDCRIRKHLTQTQLASKLGVQQQSIAKIESGEENLSLETIGRLLIVLKSGLRVSLQNLRSGNTLLKRAA